MLKSLNEDNHFYSETDTMEEILEILIVKLLIRKIIFVQSGFVQNSNMKDFWISFIEMLDRYLF